jgi:hypothetical protein
MQVFDFPKVGEFVGHLFFRCFFVDVCHHHNPTFHGYDCKKKGFHSMRIAMNKTNDRGHMMKEREGISTTRNED